MTVLYCSLRVFTCDITRKEGPKFLSSWKQIFWNVCFYRPLGRQRNYLIICKININIPCVPKQYVPWHSSCSIKREKISQIFIFAGNAAFFSKHCFSNNLLGPKKGFYRIHSFCQISLWTLINCSLRFLTSGIRRKNGPNFSLPWQVAFFFQNVVFPTTS